MYIGSAFQLGPPGAGKANPTLRIYDGSYSRDMVDRGILSVIQCGLLEFNLLPYATAYEKYIFL